MHYGPKAFSNNGKDTITARNGHSIGQRQGLSAIDVAQIKTMYAPCKGIYTNSSPGTNLSTKSLKF